MNVLIVVASKHGSTREIAEAIADELRAVQVTVQVRAADEVGYVIGYDAVILGSAVYAGSWLPAAQRFAALCRVQLGDVPIWAFSSGPLGDGTPQPQDDARTLAAPLGDVPLQDHRIFVGKLDQDQLGVGERLLVKLVKAPYGDFRDWNAIRAWAREIATALQPTTVGAG